MEEQKINKEGNPKRRQRGISAISVMVLLSLSLVGTLRLRKEVCDPDTQTQDIFACAGVNLFMLSHVFIAGKPIRDGLECIFPRNKENFKSN
jgi:hypothetical protein